MTNKNCEWYIIIRYTLEDYCGEMVDAIYAPSSVDALYIVTRGPKKPGECFRAFAAIGEVHTNTAIALSEKRRKEEEILAKNLGTIDKLATASGSITLTGTYTGYGSGLIGFPVAQGAIT